MKVLLRRVKRLVDWFQLLYMSRSDHQSLSLGQCAEAMEEGSAWPASWGRLHGIVQKNNTRNNELNNCKIRCSICALCDHAAK